MSFAIIGTWLAANESFVIAGLFLISEAIGANPKVKSNGILSFLLIHVNEFLKKRAAKDTTP